MKKTGKWEYDGLYTHRQKPRVLSSDAFDVAAVVAIIAIVFFIVGVEVGAYVGS